MPEGASLLPCLSLSVLDVDNVGQLVDDIGHPLCSMLLVSTPRDGEGPASIEC